MKTLNDYLARAAFFVNLGQPANEILVVQPLGSVWSQWAPGPTPPAVAELERGFTETVNHLLATHRDFDIGDEIILERHGRVGRGELRVGPMGRYKTVIVPPASRWSPKLRDLLSDFTSGGGKLVARGPQPASIGPRWQSMSAVTVGADLDAFEGALKWTATRTLSATDAEGREIPEILYQHRIDDELDHYYFVVNSSRDKAYRANLKVWPKGYREQWDLATGEIRPIDSLTIDLPPAGSFAFAVHTASPAVIVDAPMPAGEERVEAVSKPLRFKRQHPATLVLDRCIYTIEDAPPQGPAPVSQAREAVRDAAGAKPTTGVHKPLRVKLRFEIESEMAMPPAALVVERAGDFTVTANDQPTAAPTGWHWDRQFGTIDLRGRLRRGVNWIELSTIYRPGVEIEDVYLVGDFATKKLTGDRYILVREPKHLTHVSWVDQGYHFYAGNMSYEIPVTYSKGERIRLRLDQPAGTLFLVRVAGREIARLPWQPWEADVTSALKPGRNLLEVVVVSSLHNAFGSHHEAYGPGTIKIVRTKPLQIAMPRRP